MESGGKTLAIDLGASEIKSLILDSLGKPLGMQCSRPTPRPATPECLVEELIAIATGEPFDRVTVGFPGLVRASDGVILTAPNPDGEWRAFKFASTLQARLGRPVRVAKDADIHGFGAVSGQGVEMLLTLGTGLGSSLFIDGRLVPNLDLAHHPLTHGQSYEQLLGKRALERGGREPWEANLLRVIDQLSATFNYDALYIGGGHAALINDQILPAGVRLVSNIVGLLGSVALWDSEKRPSNWQVIQ